jgi:hypothetical protein
VRQEKKCVLRIGTETGAVLSHGLQTASKEMFVEGIQRKVLAQFVVTRKVLREPGITRRKKKKKRE